MAKNFPKPKSFAFEGRSPSSEGFFGGSSRIEKHEVKRCLSFVL